MHPASECYRVEYGAPFGSLMAAEEQWVFSWQEYVPVHPFNYIVVQESVTIVEDVHYGIPLIAKIGNGFP